MFSSSEEEVHEYVAGVMVIEVSAEYLYTKFVYEYPDCQSDDIE